MQLDKGVESLFESFSRLDSQISGVGKTAARIGDHLQVNLVIICALLVPQLHTPIKLVYPVSFHFFSRFCLF